MTVVSPPHKPANATDSSHFVPHPKKQQSLHDLRYTFNRMLSPDVHLVRVAPISTTATPWTAFSSDPTAKPAGFSFGATATNSSGFSFGKTGASTMTTSTTFGAAAAAGVTSTGFSFVASTTAHPSGAFTAAAESGDAKASISFGVTPTKAASLPTKVEKDATPQPQKVPSSQAAKTAALSFDKLDQDKIRCLSSSLMEELLEELGEGFYGDEFDAQISLIDPNKTGSLERATFIVWYDKLLTKGDNKDDGGSLDSEERAERAEEEEKAREAFMEMAQEEGCDAHVVPVAKFAELIESLGTTYC